MPARANTEGDPVILFLSDEISGMYVLTRLKIISWKEKKPPPPQISLD